MTLTRRRSLQLVGAALAAPALIPRIAKAQSWPSKSIRAIVPVSAGSTIDIISRIVFEQFSQQLGQTIVSENRAGAGGRSAPPSSRAPNRTATPFGQLVKNSATPALYPNAL